MWMSFKFQKKPDTNYTKRLNAIASLSGGFQFWIPCESKVCHVHDRLAYINY